MFRVIFAFLMGFFSSYENLEGYLEFKDQIHKRKGSYIPKFAGYWKNEGTFFKEKWVWIQPKFKKRYVNIFKERGKITIILSWNKKKNSTSSMKCNNQEEADLMIESIKSIYLQNKEVEIKHEGNLCYVNVVKINNKITIVLDRKKYDGALEVIECFDEMEGKEILHKVYLHYCEYRFTIIKNEL